MDIDVELKQICQLIREGKPSDAYAVLVDSVWPQSVSRQHLPIDEWARHLAPSEELRQWYARQKERWPEFKRRYEEELKPFFGELEQLRAMASHRRLILLSASCDSEHNQAVVLRDLLRQNR